MAGKMSKKPVSDTDILPLPDDPTSQLADPGHASPGTGKGAFYALAAALGATVTESPTHPDGGNA